MILQRLNNFFDRIRSSLRGPRRLRSERGQVILVLILIVAFAFIIYAVILNLGKISQSKTTVTIASNLAASYMASFVASYGESVFQVSLGGDEKKCGWTGIFAAILTVIIVVVAVVLAFVTGGSSLTLLTQIALIAAVAASVVGLAFAIAAEHGLTDTLNKLLSKQLGPYDLVVEQGISTALNNSIDDSHMIEDKHDLDQDRKFGLTGVTPNDKIGRFHWHYLQRLRTLKPRDVDIQFFLDALNDFLYVEDSGDWGLYDPYPRHPNVDYPPGLGIPDLYNCGVGANNSPNTPSICDPCCLPDQIDDPEVGGNIDVRPECCDTGPEGCGSSQGCGSRSGLAGAAPAYPYNWADPFDSGSLFYQWMYRPYEDFYGNNDGNWAPGGVPLIDWLSFREKLGVDDESANYNKDEFNPNGVQTYSAQLNIRLQDVTGYYRYPLYGATRAQSPDHKHGIYQLFYKIRDWRTNLRNMGPIYNGWGCHWCDPEFVKYPPGPYLPQYEPPPCVLHSNCGLNPTCYCLTTCLAPQTIDNYRLDLIVPPVAWPPVGNAAYSGSGCVDGADAGTLPQLAGYRAISPDKIEEPNRYLPGGQIQLLVGWPNPTIEQTFCSSQPSTDYNLWKRGVDNFCKTAGQISNPPHAGIGEGWPYAGRCDKQFQCAAGGPEEIDNCTCDDAKINYPGTFDASVWKDDTLDDIINGILEFAAWAEELLAQDPQQLADDLPNWYPKAAEWIEDIGGFTNRTEPGGLWEWRYDMDNWHATIGAWLGADETGTSGGTDYIGDDEQDVWCTPDMDQTSPNGPMFMAQWEELFIRDKCLTGWCCLENDDAPSNPLCSPLPPATHIQKIDEVISCLDWNANHTIPSTPWWQGKRGNADKFETCGDPKRCTQYWDVLCNPKRLPRMITPIAYFNQSVVPATAPNTFIKRGAWCLEGNPDPFIPPENPGSVLACNPLTNFPTVPNQPSFVNNLPFYDGAGGGCGPFGQNPQGTWNAGCDPLGYYPPASRPWQTWGPWQASWATDPGPDPVCQAYNILDPVACASLPGLTCPSDAYLAARCCTPGHIGGKRGPWGPTNWRYLDMDKTWECELNYSKTLGPPPDYPSGGLCYQNTIPNGAQTSYTLAAQAQVQQAKNQVAKFRKRLEYLMGRCTMPQRHLCNNPGNWKGIVYLAKDFYAILQEAMAAFDAFLNGPAAQLEDIMEDWGPIKPPLPLEVMYAWQGPAPKNVSGERANRPEHEQGYWHIVRIDVRTPGRCKGPLHQPDPDEPACASGQAVGSDTVWPDIKTYTKSWGLRRCYELDHRRGVVKARVMRYDESKDASALRLPMGETIWKPQFTNPNAGSIGGYGANTVNENMNTECGAVMGPPTAGSGLPPELEYINPLDGRAVMLNTKCPHPDPEHDPQDCSHHPPEEACWEVLNAYLRQGVYSETCAEYYFKSNAPKGFYLKFIPCKNFD